MCRFLAYRGDPVLLDDLLLGPDHSLVRQSRSSVEPLHPVNADGFGFGWYDPGIGNRPGVYRSVRPAWACRNLPGLARLIRTGHVFAHVRGAHTGMEISDLNCHPFEHDRFLFMHNGMLADFPAVQQRLRRVLDDESFLQIRGTTDSEYLFGLFLDRWNGCGRPRETGGLRRALLASLVLVNEILEDVGATEPSHLNIALTDGERIIACRHGVGSDSLPTLHLAADIAIPPGCDDAGSGGAADPDSGAGRGVVIASERFNDDAAWMDVPPHHVVTVESGLDVSIEPIGL